MMPKKVVTICFKKLIIGVLGVSSLFLSVQLPTSADETAPSADHSAQTDVSHLVQSIIHGLDYVAVDYPDVITNDGRVIDQDEYTEQLEIVTHTLGLVEKLPVSSAKTTLHVQATSLLTAIKNKVAGDKVAQQCTSMISALTQTYQVQAFPSTTPSLTEGKTLYMHNCTVCHGIDGLGNGVQATSMVPKPANFHDRERQQFRSVFSLYNTISLGVNGTAMPSFSHLSSSQRWSLAFYISNYYASESERERGHQLLKIQGSKAALDSLQKVSQFTPSDIRKHWGDDGVAVLAYLRAHPEKIPPQHISHIIKTRNLLTESLNTFRNGNHQEAYNLALASYLEGFEHIEAKLDTADSDLRKKIEKEMIAYRNLITARADIAQVTRSQKSLFQLLDNADEKLQDSSASASVNFFTALLILLREGLEAILVLAAIIAVLLKSNQRRGLPYIHAGWISALLLGILTWYIAEYFIDISSASRELTEGVSALLAAAMLIYVGIWLHNQTKSAQWRDYIKNKVSNALSKGALWGLMFVAFLAVYREVFESILFYRSLWINAPDTEHGHILGGIAVAAFILFLLAWLIMRYSVRLPITLFFRVNMVLMFFLAIIFSGKGVAALQEAGKLPIDPIEFPSIDILGIYPNAESLGVQIILIALVASWGIYNYVRPNRGKPATTEG